MSSVLIVTTAWLVVAAPIGSGDALAGQDEESLDGGSSHDASLEAKAGPCAPDMIEVFGDYCPDLDQHCLRWVPSERGAERCAQFAPSGRCKGSKTKKHFCIDRYEFPNKQGERPTVMKSWTDAQDTCRAVGKRLCGDSEWTLACEGRHHLPYPYGMKRDAQACNIDHTLLQIDEKALADPRRAPAEAARLWQGETSGTRPACKSPFGVFDMTGNVDEWVVNESGKPYRSGLKGGYWGPVRARCRPMTTTHGETFPFYQTGFRCCADAHPPDAGTH
jgi:hypothetical protein